MSKEHAHPSGRHIHQTERQEIGGASPDICDGRHPFFDKCIKTNGTFSSIEQQQAQTDKNKSSSLPLFVLEPVSYFLSEA